MNVILMIKNNDTYVSIANIGPCKICSKRKDLRAGVCFPCASFVNGEKISKTTWKLWDNRKPSNFWFYAETGDA